MTKKTTSLRLTEEEAREVEAVAQVDGMSVNELAREALREHVKARRTDPEFRARAKEIMERNRRLFERLAET